MLLAPFSGGIYLRAHMESDSGMGFFNRIIVGITRLGARVLFAVVDARWFRAMCRPVVRLLRFRRAVAIRVDGQTMYAFGIDQVALLFLYKFKANEYFEQILLHQVTKPGMTAVDVIKMDIQGAEALALQGMKAPLTCSPNVYMANVKTSGQNTGVRLFFSF